MAWGNIGCLAAIAFSGKGGDDVWNDLTSSFEQHPIPYAKVFFGDKVEIMERGLFNNDSANTHRFQQGKGSEDAGPTDVDLDIQKGCFDFFTGIFIREGSSWVFP